MRKEIYFSCDIETDGPIPGVNSMLSLGSVAFSPEGEEIDTFKVNIRPLMFPAKADPGTLEWWKRHPDAWNAATEHAQDPGVATRNFITWIERTLMHYPKHKPVCVCYPAGFDFTFIYWYCVRFGLNVEGQDTYKRCPFGFSALDIKSFVAAKLKLAFRDTVKENMPVSWFEGLPNHSHDALEDAKEQGMLFFRILNA